MKKRSRAQEIAATQKRVARARLGLAQSAEMSRATAGISPGTVLASTPKHRGRKYFLYGVSAGPSGHLVDPTHTLALRIRGALTEPSRYGQTTVYDADGKPIATIDPFTRKRTPINENDAK